MSCSKVDDTCVEFVDYAGDKLRVVTIGKRVAIETGEDQTDPRFTYTSFTVKEAKKLARVLDTAIAAAGSYV